MNFVLVGLGNPGEEYDGTRHNTGRFFAERFAKGRGFSAFGENKKLSSEISAGRVGKNKVTILLPDTFMNKSGTAVSALVKNQKAAERLVVIHDDLDLPIGRFKISFNKSAGGHRGVQSIVRAIKTEAFVRIRVGISAAGAKGKVRKPAGEKAVLDHILGKFKPAEAELMKKLSKKISEAIELIVLEGREKAMGQFNNK